MELSNFSNISYSTLKCLFPKNQVSFQIVQLLKHLSLYNKMKMIRELSTEGYVIRHLNWRPKWRYSAPKTILVAQPVLFGAEIFSGGPSSIIRRRRKQSSK